jgi:hypothetical protein
MTLLLVVALLVNSLTSYVHHGGQYFNGELRFRHGDPLALEAYRIGRHRAPHRAARLFVKVWPEHGDPWLEVGVIDEVTACGYTIRVYRSPIPGYWNTTAMRRHCPR